MGNTTNSCINPCRDIQWMWKLNVDPFSTSEAAEWRSYSDIENMIIEKAFASDESHAILDDYHINFKHNLQICNNDVNKQRPVKRIVCQNDERHSREERFLANPVSPNRAYGELYGFISPFIKEVLKDLNITRERLPSKDSTVISMIVKKAADGIIEEGKIIGKQREAEEIAKHLIERKKAGIEEVWKSCAFLYSLESFLYKKLNETMRLIGSEEHEQVWRNKVRTLGPFCLLLWDNPFNTKSAQSGTILYRGSELPSDSIRSFRNDCEKYPRPPHSFQAFTSCTRNRSVAEAFGNVLFIMKVHVAFSADQKPFSNFPDEEEELLFPGVCFTVDRVEFDKRIKKFLIYLTLQQRHNKANQQQLTKLDAQSSQKKVSGKDFQSDYDFDFAYDLFGAGVANRDGFDYDWN